MVVFRWKIRQTRFVTTDEKGIRAIKMQARFQLAQYGGCTRGILGRERRFVLLGKGGGTGQEVPWLQEIKQIPHIEQARLDRSPRTGDPQQAGIEAFEGVGNLRTGVLYSCASSVTTRDQWVVIRAKECW